MISKGMLIVLVIVVILICAVLFYFSHKVDGFNILSQSSPSQITITDSAGNQRIIYYDFLTRTIIPNTSSPTTQPITPAPTTHAIASAFTGTGSAFTAYQGLGGMSIYQSSPILGGTPAPTHAGPLTSSDSAFYNYLNARPTLTPSGSNITPAPTTPFIIQFPFAPTTITAPPNSTGRFFHYII